MQWLIMAALWGINVILAIAWHFWVALPGDIMCVFFSLYLYFKERNSVLT